jgi:hypothetical protein
MTTTISAFAGLMLMMIGSANASLVTLESHWNGSGGGLLTFTYEDSTFDSVDDEESLDGYQRGVYVNAITAATFTWTGGVRSGQTYAMQPGSASEIHIRKKIGQYPVGTTVSMIFSLYDGDQELPVDLRIEGYYPLTDDLSELPLTRQADASFLFIAKDSEWTSYYSLCCATQGMDNQLVFTVVPLPAAAYLFGFALGLIGVMRRKVSS